MNRIINAFILITLAILLNFATDFSLCSAEPPLLASEKGEDGNALAEPLEKERMARQKAEKESMELRERLVKLAIQLDDLKKKADESGEEKSALEKQLADSSERIKKAAMEAEENKTRTGQLSLEKSSSDHLAAGVDEKERQAVEQTLQKALAKAESDRAAIEKRYLEAVDRDAQTRIMLAKISSEKEAIEKSCPATKAETAENISMHSGKVKVHRVKRNAGHAVVKHQSKSNAKIAKKGGKTRLARKTTPGNVAIAMLKPCEGPKIDMNSLKKKLAGDKNLSGKNFSGMNLTGMDLSGSDLRGACLTKVVMERTDLQEANLERADLAGANLHMASLRLANINAVRLDGARLDGAVWPDSRICMEGSVGSCKDIIP